MSKSEIIWVFGSSAVGKDTFIRHIINHHPSDLLLKLGWTEKMLVECKESREWVFSNNKHKRKRLVDIILDLAVTPKSVVLIKGQDVDLTEHRLSLIQKTLADFVHKIIFIHSPAKVIMKRLETKSWFNAKKHTWDTLHNDLVNHQLKMLKKLSGFEFVAIDSEKNYKVVDFETLDFSDWEQN